MSIQPYSFAPEVAWLNVNQACNLRCRWCYAKDTQYSVQKEMTLGMAKDLVDLSFELGVKEFVLIGGEPTLWPHLFQLLTYLKERDATVSIITNAVRFSDDEYWKQYVDNPATSLGISVKAADKTTFEQATCSKMFAKSMIGVERAIKFHNCGVSAVHNNLIGADGTIEIAEQCKKMGATSFQLVLCTPTIEEDGVSTEYVIPPEKIWDELSYMANAIEKLYGAEYVNYDTQAPLCLFPKEFVEEKLLNGNLQTVCHVYSRSGINFDVEGNVIFCNTIAEIVARREVDYTDTKSLIAFMNSDEKRDEYRQVLRYPSQKCDSCVWKDDCRGGCLVNWLVYNPDEICNPVR